MVPTRRMVYNALSAIIAMVVCGGERKNLLEVVFTLDMESRSALHLFRDCIRLAHHIGGDSVKGTALKAMVRAEFEKGRNETDSQKIDVLKGAAIRGLSNYMLMANAAKDPRFQNK